MTPMPTAVLQRCPNCLRARPESDWCPSQWRAVGKWCRDCLTVARYQKGWESGELRWPFRIAYWRKCAFCAGGFQSQKAYGAFCSRRCRERLRKAYEMNARVDGKPTRSCLHCGLGMPARMRVDAGFCSARCNDSAHALVRKMAGRASTAKQWVSRATIAERDDWACGLCGGLVDRGLRHPHPMCASLDHVVPLAKGGSNDEGNLQLAHLVCNLKKRAVV